MPGLAGIDSVAAGTVQYRGRCPIHVSSCSSSATLSANLRKNTFQCFKCGAKGNQLDLWAAISNLPLHDAARDLCERLGIDVPEIKRW